MPYEEEIIRNPFSVKHWMRYIDYKKDKSKDVINLICERALRELPGRFGYFITNAKPLIAGTATSPVCNTMLLHSYKLWYSYLKLRRQQVRDLCITDPEYEDVNSAFERSLVFMHKVHHSV